VSWRSRFCSVLAEIVYPREHVLDGAAQARHLQVSSGRARGDRVAAASDVRLFPGALSSDIPLQTLLSGPEGTSTIQGTVTGFFTPR
jgi:hypothetical protein